MFRNLQCPEKLDEFNEAQRQKAATKRARVPGSKTSGDDNSGSGATAARSPVKSEGTVKDEPATGRSPVLAKEKKSLENGDEVERIMGAKRNQLTSELELYIKWCAACTAFYSLTRPIRKGEPVMGWALAKEVRRKYPDMLIDFYESRLRVRSPNTPVGGCADLAQFPHKKKDDD